MSLLPVQLKEIVQSAECECTVYFEAIHRYIAIGIFHADVLTGVVVIVEFHINSGTGETARELIPRLAAVYGGRNLGPECGLFSVHIFLSEANM